MTIVQFTDTHVTAKGDLHFGFDSAHYLRDAVAAVNALDERPLCAIVTGDLVDTGAAAEYENFLTALDALAIPFYAIPGNHDDRNVLRDVLPASAYAGERGPRVRFAIEDHPVRLIALDGNCERPWPGASLSAGDLAWLDRTLAADRSRPAIVAVHQPPFASGLPYLDAFGFRGARAVRRTLAKHPHAGRLIAGHIHHVMQAQWEYALATTAPSTVPQRIPLLLCKGKVAGVLEQRAGFAVHRYDETTRAFSTLFFRRTSAGTYEAATS